MICKEHILHDMQRAHLIWYAKSTYLMMQRAYTLWRKEHSLNDIQRAHLIWYAKSTAFMMCKEHGFYDMQRAHLIWYSKRTPYDMQRAHFMWYAKSTNKVLTNGQSTFRQFHTLAFSTYCFYQNLWS